MRHAVCTGAWIPVDSGLCVLIWRPEKGPGNLVAKGSMFSNTILLRAAKPGGSQDQQAHKRRARKRLDVMAQTYPNSWEGEAGGGGAYVSDL